MLKVTFKGLWAHKIRFLLTGIAVMLGVAFMSGTIVLTDTVRSVFDDLFSDIYENTDAVVRNPESVDAEFGELRSPVPLELADEVGAVDGVEQAEPNVEIPYAQIVGSDDEPIGDPGTGAPAFGVNWYDGPLNPFVIQDGRAPESADEVAIDLASADEGDISLGDRITILTPDPSEYEVVGTARFGTADSPAGASVSMFTLDTALALSGDETTIASVSVLAADGLSQEDVQDRLEAEFAGRDDVEVLTGDEITEEMQSVVRDQLGFFNTALLTFAFIALFVGLFIIYNTFTIIVAQRTRELALLRAIGASRRQVLSAVLGESLLVGLTASALGVVAGVFLSIGLRELMALTGFDIPSGDTVISSNAIVVGLIVGTVVTLISALVPAWRASRIAPIAALRDVAVERLGRLAVRGAIGGVIVAIGIALLLTGLFADVDNAILYVGVGAGIVFIGVFVLGPLIARPVARVLGTRPVGILVIAAGAMLALGAVGLVIAGVVDVNVALVVVGLVLGWIAYVFGRSGLGSFGITGQLSRENAIRNPKRTAATAAALMIGVALVGFITIFAASLKESIRVAIDEQFIADYVVTAGQSFGGTGVSPQLTAEMRELPELGAVTGIRLNSFTLLDDEVDPETGERGGSADFLVAADPVASQAIFEFGFEEGSLLDLERGDVAISEDRAEEKGWAVGDTIDVRFQQTGVQQLEIIGVYTETTAAGNFLISLDTYEENFAQQLDFQVFAQLADGVTPEEGRAAIDPLLEPYPTAELSDLAQYADDQASQIDQVVNLIYVLLALAVVIAAIGIANTLALSIHERTRELGLLRAVGMSRVQTRLSVRWESVIISLLGTALGLVIGLFFGWAVVEALRDEGFAAFDFAPGQLAIVVVVAAVVGVLASVFPARRAAKLDVLEAISYE